MITYYVRHGTCYRHRGLPSSTGPRTHRASSSYIQGMSLEARPESTGERPGSPLSPAHVVPIYLVGLRRSLVRLVQRRGFKHRCRGRSDDVRPRKTRVTDRRDGRAEKVSTYTGCCGAQSRISDGSSSASSEASACCGR